METYVLDQYGNLRLCAYKITWKQIFFPKLYENHTLSYIKSYERYIITILFLYASTFLNELNCLS